MHVQIVTFGLNDVGEADYVAACQEETPAFGSIPGLQAKIWLRDADSQTYGAVYLWRDREAYEDYLKGEVWAAVEGDPALSGVQSRDFDVIEQLTRETQPGVALV